MSAATTEPTKRGANRIETYSKIIFAFVALWGIIWGVIKYREDRRLLAETRRIEAVRPFLERQLELYTEATQVAAQIAVAKAEAQAEAGAATEAESGSPPTALQLSRKIGNPIDPKTRFWQLYWGELALVEDTTVEEAMVEYGTELRGAADAEKLKKLSLDLAHACRNSLAESWGVSEWRRPDHASAGTP